MHDTLPLTPLTAGSPRQSGFYKGDAWKKVLCLRALRPDLHVATLPVAPAGLTLVAGLNRQSSLLCERRADVLVCYGRLDAARAIERPETVL